ncbi:Hypothetical protein A7982_06796 [Minicystis rosea]|nr:Hypothetical protein A7982_06796 [Minicystis rosea]
MPASLTIGRALGGLFAPLAALGSFLRGARLFHPDGVLYRADVEPEADDAVAHALAGTAVVRFSGALWRWPAGAAWPDILGAAVRFHPGEARAQDLLFATFRSVPEMLIAVLTTNVRDFLGNTYATVLPLRAPELGAVDLRLVPELRSADRGDRNARLARAVRDGRAILALEVRERRPGSAYRPLARITLREPIAGGGEDLRFDPIHAGVGIEPIGVLQAIRTVVYPASQLGRALARGRLGSPAKPPHQR